ncbi:MAG TPA: transglycosylase SLT domain-containing protein, partial [Thermodesulfobacteriota bacterium]|nr:transglycosylase SLT domain-containing protein [Thermodesulfobacteriota bacterium]
LVAQARESLEKWDDAVKAYQDLWLKFPLSPLAPQVRSRWETLAREKQLRVEKIVPQALWERAYIFYQAKSYDAAISEMNRIEGFPADRYPAEYKGEPWIDDLYYHRGMCHFHLKQYSRSIEVFDMVVRNARSEGAEKGLFARFQALIRTGRWEEAAAAYDLFSASYPKSSSMPHALYLRAAVAEEMGQPGKAVAAYRELAEKFPQSSWRDGALWSAGWILYRTGNHAEAVETWDRLRTLQPHFRWVEKILYWKGRALEKMNRKEAAQESYRELLKEFPYSYYSRLAAPSKGVGERKGTAFLREQRLSCFLNAETGCVSKNEHLEKGRMLTRLSLLPLAADEFEAAEGEGKKEETWLEISRLYREAEEYARSALLVRRKFALKPLAEKPAERERALYALAYPAGNFAAVNRLAESRNLDPALLCAVILEESRFDPRVVSQAGARGLMQLMPATGKKAAKDLKIQPFTAERLFDPEVNLQLGSWYLSKVLEEFGGKVHLAVAAYNAGPHNVRKWLAARPVADDEFVETIPYAETRNYVVRVMSSAEIYRALYRPPEAPAQP